MLLGQDPIVRGSIPECVAGKPECVAGKKMCVAVNEIVRDESVIQKFP